tara:strand:- start:540 stop:1622 length:1083 start_codon:yes stop_codon:yes gene_type:complete
MSSIKKILILSLGTITILEFISFGFFKLNLLEISHTPKIYLDKGFVPNDEWWTEEKPWGAWHMSSSATNQKRSCYNVIYKSNEIGARDDNFINKDNDVLLLGDSFAEGYGVDLDNSSQKYIEKFTNLNVLNFGVSRNFGPLQYFLIYENLAKNFLHQTILIYLLPDNDFSDNDYNNWQGSKRYRPYYKSINSNHYSSFIPEQSVKNYLSSTKKLKKILKDYFWTSNLFINVNYNYRIYRSNKKKSSFNFSGYFDSDINQQKAVIYFLDKIIENTSSNVVLVSIPRPNDFDRLKKGSDLSDVYWNKYYVNKDTANSNFKFIDLINYEPDNVDEIYLKCDGHWSPKGNLWAARIISKFIRKN